MEEVASSSFGASPLRVSERRAVPLPFRAAIPAEIKRRVDLLPRVVHSLSNRLVEHRHRVECNASPFDVLSLA